MSAVSAIAARRAKAQAQAQAQAQSQAISAKGIDAARSPAVDSGEEPPMKKARSNAPKSSRITRSKQKEITRQQVQIQEEIAEVSSDVTSDDEDGGVSIVNVESETQDDAWDGLENSALNDEGRSDCIVSLVVRVDHLMLTISTVSHQLLSQPLKVRISYCQRTSSERRTSCIRRPPLSAYV